MATAPNARTMAAAARATAALNPGVAETDGRTKLGPFVIDYRMNDEEAHVKASVKVGPLKANLFSGTVTRRRRSISGRASTVVQKASLKVEANFDKMTLTATGQVCHKVVRPLKIKWECRKYSARIA